MPPSACYTRMNGAGPATAKARSWRDACRLAVTYSNVPYSTSGWPLRRVDSVQGCEPGLHKPATSAHRRRRGRLDPIEADSATAVIRVDWADSSGVFDADLLNANSRQCGALGDRRRGFQRTWRGGCFGPVSWSTVAVLHCCTIRRRLRGLVSLECIVV